MSDITLARHPLTGRYDGMPRSAIAAGNLEQTQVNSHLIDLLASVDLPMLMLSDDPALRHLKPQAQQLLNLIARRVGRPITDIRPVDIHVTHLKKALERERRLTEDGRELEVWLLISLAVVDTRAPASIATTDREITAS